MNRLLGWMAATVALAGFTPAASVADQLAYAALPVTVAPPAVRSPERDLAKGMFLVASRQLSDPNFTETVVLLLEYDEQGALGLIINRPTKVQLARLLPEVEELRDRGDVLYVGGPVSKERIVLLMRSASQPMDSGRVFADTYVSSSLTALKEAISNAPVGDVFHAYAGYAGWAPGQLDGEVLRGDWHISPAEETVVFDKQATEIWPDLIEMNSGLWVRRSAPGLQVASGEQ